MNTCILAGHMTKLSAMIFFTFGIMQCAEILV